MTPLVPMAGCCAQRLALRWANGYPTHEGSTFGCAACGRVYERRGVLWVNADPVEQIRRLNAEAAQVLAHVHQRPR